MGGGAIADERKQALEDSYRKKVLDVIENIAGPGAAKVTVSLDVDFNRVTQSSEKFDPDGRVRALVLPRSRTRPRSADAAPGDETTVANNVPTGAAPPVAPALPKSQSNDQPTPKKPPTTRSPRPSAPRSSKAARIKRLSVAVAIDHMRVPGAEGAPATYQPRPPEELDAHRRAGEARPSASTSSAATSSPSRARAFARPDTTMDDATAPGPFDFDKFDLVRGGEIGALLITALALVFFVLRPLIGGLFAKPEPDDLPPEILALKGGKRAKAIAAPGQAHPARRDAAPHAGDAGRRQPPPLARTAAPSASTCRRPSGLDAGIDVARISGQVKASSIKKISEVVASHPDESIAIIRSLAG